MLKLPRHPRAILAIAVLMVAGSASAAEPKIVPDVVYGHKDGMALTFDVIEPEAANGAGVLFIQSGGWYSGWTEPKNLVPAAQPLLDKGLTVFIVRHGSAPKYTVPEAAADVQRCVRYLHLHAKEWNVDPQRLGAFGGSAGGHLTLMLATTGDDGDPAAKDEVLQQSSRIAAAVALYPPTDLRRWTTEPPEEIAKHAGLKPPLTFAADLEDDVSPLLHVTKETPPTLLIHGDKDTLVPIVHSQNMINALHDAKIDSKLLTIEGAGHGFNGEQNKVVVPAMVDWFVDHLSTK
jgi:acetyl esterase/lipase